MTEQCEICKQSYDPKVQVYNSEGNLVPEITYCETCDHWFCWSCQKDYPARVLAAMKEGNLKNIGKFAAHAIKRKVGLAN